ncbi:MAG: CHASE2 domain-containing protein [Ginsengibacter sp.]
MNQEAHGLNLYEFFYAEKNKNQPNRDTNIVLVEIENDRKKIADQLNIIKGYKPAVIGIDAIFTARKDSLRDSKLIESVKPANNIVFASRMDVNNSKLSPEVSFFIKPENGINSGYINFETDRYKVVREYAPFWEANGEVDPAFTSRIIQLYSPEKFTQLKKRHHAKENITYTGNTERYTAITKEDLNEYNDKNQLSSLLKNKIILLGHFIKYPPLDTEDIHFSPLNTKAGNNSNPDMYGVVIHANILSMILDNSYPKITSAAVSFLIAFVFAFLFLLYIIYTYSENDPPSYSKMVLIQFLLIAFVLYFLLQVYNFYSWKVPLSPVLISLILCVELSRFYKLIALRLNKKINYKTVFT